VTEAAGWVELSASQLKHCLVSTVDKNKTVAACLTSHTTAQRKRNSKGCRYGKPWNRISPCFVTAILVFISWGCMAAMRAKRRRRIICGGAQAVRQIKRLLIRFAGLCIRGLRKETKMQTRKNQLFCNSHRDKQDSAGSPQYLSACAWPKPPEQSRHEFKTQD
jgi:hypothetical protein